MSADDHHAPAESEESNHAEQPHMMSPSAPAAQPMEVVTPAASGWTFLATLLYLSLSIGSLYLAYRCAKGFSIIQLLLAFFFPLCYIPYGLYACL